jgi:endonuclease YncB( thermonuclease family)
MHKLLRNAVLLDTETLGLEKGHGLHEVAVFDLNTKAAHEFVLTPNWVNVIKSRIKQEHTHLATSKADVSELIRHTDWMSVIKDIMVKEGHVSESATHAEVKQAIEAAKPWIAKALNKYPHLNNAVGSPADQQHRLEQLQRMGGVTSLTSKSITPEELVRSGGELESLVKGKTIWFANAAFDSKQVGAVIQALDHEGQHATIKNSMQTSGTSHDPFYVTGVEVNKAKVTAQQTGDWTPVWKAYLSDVPKPGETAVRDVQDVIKSMMSYGQKLGLAKQGDVYWGTSLDLVYKLMGSLEPGKAGMEKLLFEEAHRAVEDNAINLQYVLDKAVHWTSALQEVHEDTDLGKQYLNQAQKQSGPLYEVAAFLKRQEMIRPEAQRVNVIKRLGRAQTDILEEGKTWQVDGWRAVSQVTQQTPGGETVSIPLLNPNRIDMTKMEDVVSLLNSSNRYSDEVNVAAELTNMTRAINSGQSVMEQKAAVAKYVDETTSNLVNNRITAEAEIFANTFNNNIGKAVSRAQTEGTSIGRAASALSHAQVPALLKNWGMIAGGLAATGLVWSLIDGNAHAARQQPSLVTYNYQEWLSHQAEFSGMRPQEEQNQGMSERGLAGKTRRKNTDFGSPYSGIQASQSVFINQKLLQEREKWLRQQYGATYYDPTTGLFGLNGIMTRAMHQGYSYLPGGEKVKSGYRGLRGGNLMKVNLGDGNWKMTVEDADTITLQRGGIRGAIANLFGLNEHYAFRLAGVDSPEVTHPGQLSGGQPQGTTSLEGLQALMASANNAEVVFDPTQTTYGRSMGVFFANNKNVNFELVKRGLAAHLPYGKPQDSIIDYSVMKSMESGAAAMGRGMWQHPYWKTLYDVTKASGERPTFNTLTKPDKLVEQVSQMNTLALMENAEQQGMYSTAMATEAASIGKFTHRGVDKVQPFVTGNTASYYNSYLHQMQEETSLWMANKGTRHQVSMSPRAGYGKLDHDLVIDSLSQTNNIWNRDKLETLQMYDTKSRTRKTRQSEMQQQINQTIFQSQINHTRM